jgi:hypothetical protein
VDEAGTESLRISLPDEGSARANLSRSFTELPPKRMLLGGPTRSGLKINAKTSQS